MKKVLLVGTVFSSANDAQLRWLDLQLRFLKATTPIFDHVTFLYGEKRSEFEERTTIIQDPHPRPSAIDCDNIKGASADHIRGLNALATYFKKHQNQYNHFLFLDSDAFPIRCGWLPTLRARMNKYRVGIPIRFENMETRFHSSILFINQKATLPRIEFSASHKLGRLDLLSRPECDVVVPALENRGRFIVYPLLRSNKLEIHKLLCGVYYDMFYHHGCGCRKLHMRGVNYWKKTCSMDDDLPRIYEEELMTDPNSFIHELAGWNKKEYAVI
jgi:hypothetical protein